VRVDRWRATGEVPGPVMVWTSQQTGVFLQRAQDHRLWALYHLVSRTGLRRGEACALEWGDLDLDAGVMAVSRQIVQIGWTAETTAVKSEASERVVALDAVTVRLLREEREQQRLQSETYRPGWVDTGLVFTQVDGGPWHPAHVTAEFQRLTREADLPPIRLHDLRHGAATHALTAGVDIKVVQEMLGHSSRAVTSDTYTSVVSDAQRAAAEAIARVFDAATPTGDPGLEPEEQEGGPGVPA